MSPTEIYNLIDEQLKWRGPNGKRLGHIVLKREDAAVVHAILWKLLANAKVRDAPNNLG